MAVSNYNTGFPSGVTIRDIPIIDLQNGNGKVYWVDSNAFNASDANKGKFNFPLKTIQSAVNKCVANRGEKIIVAAGHIETISHATNNINFNVSGIQVFGLGTGLNRPKIISHTDIDVFVQISAANVYISNINFECQKQGQVKMIGIGANNSTFFNCLMTTNIFSPLNHVFITNEAAYYASNEARFENFEINNIMAGGVTVYGFKMNKPIDTVSFINCTIKGEFANSIIYAASGAEPHVSNLSILGGTYLQTNPTAEVFSVKNDTSTTISPDTIIINGTKEGTLVTSETGGRVQHGEKLIYTKTFDANRFTLSEADIIEIKGSFILEDVIFETDGTGLATATNIRLTEGGGTFGSSIIFEETVTNLGPNVSIDLAHASIVGVRRTLFQNNDLQIQSTGAIATGGQVKITVVFRVINDSSTVITA